MGVPVTFNDGVYEIHFEELPPIQITLINGLLSIGQGVDVLLLGPTQSEALKQIINKLVK
jgi:ABC-type sugar transport system substrate-binding protein